jgi:hypothetical protein
VFYMFLGLTKNLLSVSVMIDLGCIVEFDDQQVIIQRRCPDLGQVLARGIQEGGLYRLLVDLVRALVHDSDNLCKLWHKRLGHLHYKALPILKDMVQGLLDFKIKKIEVCKGCALGKHAKTAFPSSEHRSREILDLIHSDVCGPMTSTSLSGNIYYVSFIDDSSWKTWIYFMKTKDEVFEKFQEFKALVENQTGKKIKVLRSDNGGEYISKEFDTFCREARDQEGADSALQPTTKWGCRKEEQVHHRDCQGNDP